MLGEHINFDIHFVAWMAMTKCGDFCSVRNHCDFERVDSEIENSEADAVNGAAAFFNDVAHELARDTHDESRSRGDNFAHGINMTKNNVATKATIGHHGALEVHRVARRKIAQIGAGVRFFGHIGQPPVGTFFYEGEAAAIDSNRCTNA